jgi:hypothetical protein
MKQNRWITHTVYLLVISTLLVGIWGLNHARLMAKAALRAEKDAKQNELEKAFDRLCTELSGDLFSAVEADNSKLFLTKMTQVQTAAGQALLLLSEDGRKTPWITFWESLERFAQSEMEQVLEKNALPSDRLNLTQLAELTRWLSEHPGVLLDETTKSLPDELHLPTLQTAYAVDEIQTRNVARRVLGVRGGLTYQENGPPGVRSYICNNARVDVLQSGELFYFDLQLKTGKGEISAEQAGKNFLEFAKREGFGTVQIIDLYVEDGLYRGKMAPLSYTAELGKIPDLDRTLEIACTAWNGRVCFFSAGRYYMSNEEYRFRGTISERKIEALAKERGARIGAPFLYRGRICRPLIYERGGIAGRAVLCVDASNGTAVDLFYVPHGLSSYHIGERVLF